MKPIDDKLAKEIDWRLPYGKHGKIEEVDDFFLTNVFMLDEKSMFDFIKDFALHLENMAYTEEDVIEEPRDFLYFKGNIPILLCSHVDTVKNPPTHIYLTENTKLLTAHPQEQLGGDDRAGVAGMLLAITDGYKPHLLFTKGEEHGLEGATEASKSMVTGGNSSNKYGINMLDVDIRCIIGLDRSGDGEVAFYNNGNEDFKKWIKSFDLKEVIGTGSDIRVLCPAWKVSGANVSIGYESAHSTRDYVSMPSLYKCIKRVEKMLENPPPDKIPFVENKAYQKYKYKKETYYYPVKSSCNYGRGRMYGERLYYDEEYTEYKRKKRDRNYFPASFHYRVSPAEREKIFGAMNFISFALKNIYLDFEKMTWHYANCDNDDIISSHVFETFDVWNEAPEGARESLKKAVRLLESMSYLWADDYYLD